MFLLAGVSYYKTAAPPVIDLGGTALTEAELAFLREFYLQGLGEFAYRNALDLSGTVLVSGGRPPQTPPPSSRGDPSPRTLLGRGCPPPVPPAAPRGAHRWCRSAAGSTRSWWWSGSGGWPTPRCSW